MYVGDPRWNHPPPLFSNAIDLLGVARTQGFQASSQPAPGGTVVYGSSYGVFGHIATVVAVEPGRYEVVSISWTSADLRSVARPDASVVGFVVTRHPADRSLISERSFGFAPATLATDRSRDVRVWRNWQTHVV